MDDNDQVIFYPNQGVDPHNRCCGGSMWCIQVIYRIFSYDFTYMAIQYIVYIYVIHFSRIYAALYVQYSHGY